MKKYLSLRNFMKSSLTDTDIVGTADIAKGVPQPAFQEPLPEGAQLIPLPAITRENVPRAAFFDCTLERCSRRTYSDQPLSLYELAFLLWCTQGVKKVIPGYRKYLRDGSGRNVLRPVAAGGCINAYDTTLALNRVAGLEPGIYGYRPLDHALAFLRPEPNLGEKVEAVFTNPSQNQHYTTEAGALFFWTCSPYRGEWRYQHTAHKIMLLDLGHISQNLYLAAEALGCGCCAIGGYYQEKADALVGVDGQDQFTVLCAAVGHIEEPHQDVYRHLPDFRAADN